MNTLTSKFFAASIAALCALAPTVSRADKVAREVADYTVFLDPSTGFVFVKLPVGWKFVGKVTPSDVARAPGNVVTAMLVDADASVATNAVAPSRDQAARAATLAVAISAPAWAQQTDRRSGDHPAVIVQRLHAQQGYDYASKFYPHPAWFYLQVEAPHPMMEHPAVIVFKRHQQEALAAAAKPQLELVAADGR